MSLQQYTPWFAHPAPNPVQEPPFSHPVHPVHPYDKEPMFEKPLTPSDVGKLNRLVIPKLQAEKYFPLGGGAAAAGTLLAFADEDGKEWRFRYSYWTSSQSYVLTKGWSRYVKEKRLETGDVVVFERHRGEPRRMFIGWRRPGSGQGPTRSFATHALVPYHLQFESVHPPPGAEEGGRRHVRLFGVNLECEQEENSPPSTETTSSGASDFFPTPPQQQSYHYYFDHYNEYNPHHM